MKKTVSIVLSIVLLISFAACTAKKHYRDDTACEALAVNAMSAITLSDTSLTFTEKGEISLSVEPYISEAVSSAKECAVRFTGGASFDEFGIFHCADETETQNVKTILENYLESKAKDEVYRSYFPGEEYKLDEAEVKIFGNYVSYAILSADNRSAFFAEIDQLLLEA